MNKQRSVTQKQFDEAISAQQLQAKLAAVKMLNDSRNSWLDEFFTDREQRLIANCIHYTHNDPGGLPGHNLMILVSKMAAIVDMRESE